MPVSMNRFIRHLEEEDRMGGAEKRKYERVDTNVKVKLPGDSVWTECISSNVSAGGLCFDTVRPLSVGDVVTLQFMLPSRTGTDTKAHFLASSRVIRIIPEDDTFSVSIIASNLRTQVSASPLCGVFISRHSRRTRAGSAVGHGNI